jgi:protein O-mannosyl-transferase
LAPKSHKPAARRKGAEQRPRARAPAERRRPRIDSGILAPALALAVTAIAYLRCFGNGFVYDDHEMIVVNPQIANWSFLWKSFVNDVWWFRPNGPFPKSAYYRPLEDVWLGLNYQLFGFNPVGWHVTIVAVHLVVVYLVFRVAEELVRNRWAATIAALLFGLLPLHAQAVAWPTAIPFPISVAFELGALLVFMHRARAPQRSSALAVALYAGALLSHESAVTFPAIAGAYVFLLEEPPGREGAPLMSDLGARAMRAAAAIAPLAAAVMVYLGLRLWILGFISRPAPHNLATWAQVFLSIPAVLANYAVLLLVPWLAGPAHQFHFVSTPAAPAFYLPLLGLCAVGAAAVLLLRGSPHRRIYLFLAFWIFAALAPVLNVRTLIIDTLISDRYLYLPSVAFCIVIADLGAQLAAAGAQWRDLATALAVTVLGVLGVVLWHVQGYWHDEIALFGKCVEEFPESTLCHGRLGLAFEHAGDLAGAAREFRRTLQLNPNEPATLYDLGMLDENLGRHREAADELARAFAVMPDLPPRLYLQLARAAEEAGQPERADEALAHAATDPAVADYAAFLKAEFLTRRGDHAGSEEVLRDLAARNVGTAEFWRKVATALTSEGGAQEGAFALSHAAELAPQTRLPPR